MALRFEQMMNKNVNIKISANGAFLDYPSYAGFVRCYEQVAYYNSWLLADCMNQRLTILEGPGEIQRLPQVTDTLYHIMLYRAHLVWAGFELTTLEMIITNCIGR